MIEQALDLTEKLMSGLNTKHMGEFNREDTRATLEGIQSDGVLIVHESGLIGGSIGTSPINRSHRIAYERIFYAEAGLRSLIKEFEAWAIGQGVNAVALSCFCPRIGKIYERSGYSMLETYYVKGV